MTKDLDPRAGEASGLLGSDGSDGAHPHPGHEQDEAADAAILPAATLVDALAHDRRITDLGASSVPMWLMAEPIEVALDLLEVHARQCRHPQQCPETPGPMRPLLKMRRAARKQNEHVVHVALWRYVSYPLIEQVRAMVAERHEDLVTQVKTGALFAPAALAGEVDAMDMTHAQSLAAGLWSTGLEDPRAVELFCLLPVLVREAPGRGQPDEAAAGRAPVEAVDEKPRHRDKRIALERRVAELEGELSRARESIRARAEELVRAQRTLEGVRTELDSSTVRVTELEDTVRTASERSRAIDAELRGLERLHKQSANAAAAYRIDLERAQAELAEVEAERAALMGRLASASARVQELEAHLRAMPRDREAIDDWLRREEARLRELESTVEGGARERVADDKRLRRKLELAFVEAYPEFRPDRPPVVGGTRSLTFRALGGGNEVGRSAYLVSIGSHDVLVDCGIAVGSRHEEDRLPDISSLHRLDALLVTHAHTDHVGWIPALVAALDYFPIYCTKPTAELLPIMLRDSRTHYVRSLAAEQLKRAFDPGASEVTEAYGLDDIFETDERLIEARVGEATGIGATDLTATFFPAGHILGAASVVVDGGGRRVVLSGDISSAPQHTVAAFDVPDYATDADLLVLESTYGNRSRPTPSVAEHELVSFVANTVARGIALLPCFALGRAQEVVAILKNARREGRLPGELRILVDGMINKINPIYASYAKLEPADFIEVTSQLDREMAMQSAVGPDHTPTVVVTTSGMLAGGPVIEWARRLLPDPRHRMALLGYQDEGAPGGLLRKLARERPPHTLPLRDDSGEPLDVVVATGVPDIGLSAHADQDGLVRYAAAVHAKRIVLVHGDDDARATLRDRLIRENVCQDVDVDGVIRVA